MKVELSILVPAFNELVNLKRYLPVMQEQAAACTDSFEILVVDDGSVDQTPELVRKAAQRDRRIRLVRHPRNLGPGAAIPTGLFWARGDWLMLVPADLACRPEDLQTLWKKRRDASVVVGLRSDRSDYGLLRKLLSVSYIASLRLLSGSSIRQFNYLQMYRRQIFERLETNSLGVFVTAEVILSAQMAGLIVEETGLRYVPRLHGRALGASGRAVVRCGLEALRFFSSEPGKRLAPLKVLRNRGVFHLLR